MPFQKIKDISVKRTSKLNIWVFQKCNTTVKPKMFCIYNNSYLSSRPEFFGGLMVWVFLLKVCARFGPNVPTILALHFSPHPRACPISFSACLRLLPSSVCKVETSHGSGDWRSIREKMCFTMSLPQHLGRTPGTQTPLCHLVPC